ncbi:hypothetical protein CDAR_619221 [Caerostris darwini]|uniref:Uncharacterized protein n=1 Tax=Caerostris darwini TaxID=1538125 RepID=A0AAV4U2Q4_9ARAC|nr:hypothetical protein CDAR_619221 [Caerostris darwini]
MYCNNPFARVEKCPISFESPPLHLHCKRRKKNNIIQDSLTKRNCCNSRRKNRRPLLKQHHCEHGFTGGKSSPANSSSKEGGNLSVFSRYHLPLVAGHQRLDPPPRVREGWPEEGGKKWLADKA